MVTASAFVLLLLSQLSLLILSIISGLASARFSLLSHGAAQPDDALAMTFIDVTVVIFGVVLPLTTIACLAVVQRHWQSRTPLPVAAVVPMPSSRALERLPSEPLAQTRSLNLNIEVMATVTTMIPGGGSARSGAMSTATTSVTASGSSAAIARADGRPPRSRAPPPGPSESLVLDPCIGRQRLRRCAGTCSGKSRKSKILPSSD